jgi:hypothetical protein
MRAQGRPHRLSQRAAREAEALREIGLARQPIAGPQLARDDHLLDLGDGVVGDTHLDEPPRKVSA